MSHPQRAAWRRLSARPIAERRGIKQIQTRGKRTGDRNGRARKTPEATDSGISGERLNTLPVLIVTDSLLCGDDTFDGFL
jgi:hypothetical protein